MRRVFFILLCCLPLVGFTQKLKKVRHYDGNTGNTEIYYVLKSDPNIKQGRYIKADIHGFILFAGFYKNGMKDSLWIQSDPNTKHIFSRGYYTNDTVSSIYEYYDQKGELAQKYDFINRRLIYNKPMTNQPVFNIDSLKPGDLQGVAYIGGDWAIISQLKKFIQYPAHAREQSIQGRVVVSFYISAQGKATGHKVIQSVDPELDREALRVSKLIADRWIPAHRDGVVVPVQYNFPVEFRINEVTFRNTLLPADIDTYHQ